MEWKVAVVFVVALLSVVVGQEGRAVESATDEQLVSKPEEKKDGPQPLVFVNQLPADQLRDFPGFCFGTATCRLYKVGQSWTHAPNCSISSCTTTEDGKHMVEVRQDCGPTPVSLDGCEISREGQAQSTEVNFPDCCPIYTCAEGKSVDYGIEFTIKNPPGEEETAKATGN